MKYFYARVTTQFYGMEWTEKVTVRARSKENAIKAINAMNLTHFTPYDEDEEAQYPVGDWDVQEITKAEFEVLRKFYV